MSSRKLYQKKKDIGSTGKYQHNGSISIGSGDRSNKDSASSRYRNSWSNSILRSNLNNPNGTNRSKHDDNHIRKYNYNRNYNDTNDDDSISWWINSSLSTHSKKHDEAISKDMDDDDVSVFSKASRFVSNFLEQKRRLLILNQRMFRVYSLLSILLFAVWITILRRNSDFNRNKAHQQQIQQQLQISNSINKIPTTNENVPLHVVYQSRKDAKNYLEQLREQFKEEQQQQAINSKIIRDEKIAEHDRIATDLMDKSYLLKPKNFEMQQQQQEKKQAVPSLRQSFKDSGNLLQYDSDIEMPKSKQEFKKLLQTLRKQSDSDMQNINKNDFVNEKTNDISNEKATTQYDKDDDAWALEHPSLPAKEVDIEKQKVDRSDQDSSKIELPTDNVQTSSAILSSENPEHTIGYVVPIISCPNAPDNPLNLNPHGKMNKPKLAREGDANDFTFADAYAVLLHSIRQMHSLNENPKYTFEVYAFIHSNAVICTSEIIHSDSAHKSFTINRQEVLQQIGYNVIIVDEPVQLEEINGDYLRQSLAKTVGIADTIRLHAYTFTNHSAIVLLDKTTLLLKPLDPVFDSLLLTPNSTITDQIEQVQTMGNSQIPSDVQAFYSRDLSSITPQKWHSGYDLTLFIFKPNKETYTDLVALLREGHYEPDNGWGGVDGFGNYLGSMGTKGLITYYYEHLHPNKTAQLHKCIYTNRNENPFIRVSDGRQRCRDVNTPTEKCGINDCRNQPFDQIVAANLAICRYPWICFHHPQLDNYRLCREFTKKWYQYRTEIDTHTERTGKFYPHITLGYCKSSGEVGYLPMVKL